MKLAMTALFCVLALGAGVSAKAQTADIKIGVTISTTGPAAALGIPQLKTMPLLPKEIGGVKLSIIQLDDGGDPAIATTNARRFVSEDKVDILMGSSITPTTIAVANVAAEAGVPHFGLGPMPFRPEQKKWTVIMPQPVPLMAQALFGHMKAHNVKTLGMIGFSDSWGDLWIGQFNAQGKDAGLSLVANERYARADTSVLGQTLKIIAAKPDAVLVAGSGTGAALPQIALREHGYKGLIYQTHGAVTYDFIRIAGKAAEGAILASGPVMAAELQDDKALTKPVGVAYVTSYEAKNGVHSRTQFGAHIYDAFQILERIVPVALKVAKPGTPEFRDALRKALKSEHELAASQGVYNFTTADRYGVDNRARILLKVKDGAFVIEK